jgi:hypothetical protein
MLRIGVLEALRMAAGRPPMLLPGVAENFKKLRQGLTEPGVAFFLRIGGVTGARLIALFWPFRPG